MINISNINKLKNIFDVADNNRLLSESFFIYNNYSIRLKLKQ